MKLGLKGGGRNSNKVCIEHLLRTCVVAGLLQNTTVAAQMKKKKAQWFSPGDSETCLMMKRHVLELNHTVYDPGGQNRKY